jgi:hypothetical protein
MLYKWLLLCHDQRRFRFFLLFLLHIRSILVGLEDGVKPLLSSLSSKHRLRGDMRSFLNGDLIIYNNMKLYLVLL